MTKISQQPARSELRRRRCVAGFAFRHALLDPLPDHRNLAVREPALVLESIRSRFRFPGRHETRGCDRSDDLALLRYIRIRKQRERRSFTGPVTRGAVVVNDRGDLSIERDRLTRRTAAGRHQAGERKNEGECFQNTKAIPPRKVRGVLISRN